MFERRGHQHVAQVLTALDADLLRHHHCNFGGGTAMVLRYGEYRESVDLGFMVSDLDAYRALRRRVAGGDGVGALMAGRHVVEQLREVRADQYGIRTQLGVSDAIIKFEIVFEARIGLDEPQLQDVVCGVSTLTEADLAASKLLANSDRWGDAGVFSRDLIDLAMMEAGPAVWRRALRKAESAYGDSIRRDLHKAIELATTREGWLDRCIQALSFDHPKALLWQRIKRLERIS